MGEPVAASRLVLIAEDDERQAEVLRRYLDADGYATHVVHDGVSALNAARRLHPDLIVLDVMMPGLNGLEVCRALRRDAQVPILVLTARTGEDDLLASLDLGADDHMTKPYSPRELMARIRTLLRRTAQTRAPEGPVHRVGPVIVDVARHRLVVDGVRIDCTAGEFAIMAAMAARADTVFTREQLLITTRGTDRSSTQRSVDVHVMNLRRKLRDVWRPSLIHTVYGVGYRLSSAPE